MSSATSSTPGSGAHTVASSEMNQSPPRHLVIHAVHSEKMNGAPPRQSAAHQVTSLSTDAGPVKPAPAHAVTAEESDVKVASLAATPAVASEEKEVRAPKSSPVHAVPVEEAETQAPQHDGVHAVTSEEMAVPAPRESGSLEKAAADMLQDNPENEAGKEELSPDCGRGSLNTEVFNRRCSQSLSRLRDGAPSRAASIAGPRSEGENATSAPVIESSKVDEGTITSGAALFPVPKVAPLADFRQGAEHPALLDGVLELQRPHLETWRFDSPEEANRARRQSAEVAVYVWNYLEFLSHCRAGDEEQADQEVLEEVARRAKWVSDGIPLVPVEATTEEQKLDTEDSTEKQAVIESAGDAICATAGDGDAATDTNTALNTDKPEPHTATAVAHPYGSVFEHMDEKTFGVLLRTQQIRDPALAVSVLSYVRRLSRKDPFVSERTQSEEENEDASNSDEEGCLDETLFVAGKPAALQKKEPAKIHRSGKKRRPVITVANEIFLRELALHSRNYELQCFSALANRVGGLSYEYKEATGSLVPESIATVHSHEQKRPSKEGRRHGKREDGGEQEHKKHHSHHEKGTNGHSKHQSQIIDPDNELEMLRKMEEEAEESGGTESPEAQSPGGFSDIMSGVLHGLKALILTEEEVGETFGQLTAAELEELEAWKRGDPNVKVPRLMQDKLIGDAAELEEEAEESGGGLFGSLLKTSGVQGVLDEAQAVECTPRSPSQKEAWEETCQRLKTRRYSLTPKSKAFSTSAKEREMASKDDNTMNSFMATDTELQKLARESMKEEEHQRRKQLKEETRERKNSHKMHVSKSFTGGDEEALEEEEEAKCGDAPAQVLLIEGAGQQTGGASKEDQLYGGEALDETKNNNSGIGSFFVQMLPSNVTGVRRPSRHSHRRLSKRTMSQSMENYENERGLFDDAIDSDGEVKRDSIAKKVSGSVASLIRIVTEDQDKKDRVTQPLIRNGMSGNRRKTYYRTPSLTPGEPRIRPQEVLESKAIVEQPEVIPYEDAAKSAATQPLYVPRGSRRNSKGPHHHRQHGLGGSIVAFFEDAHTAVFGGTDVRGIDEFQAGLDAMPETNNKEIVAKEKVAAFFADQRNTNSDVRPDVKEILGDDKPFGSLDDSPATVDAANPAKRAEAAVAPPADSKKRHHHRSEPEPSAKDSSRQGGSEAKSAPTAAQAPKTQPVKQGDLHIDGVTSVLAPIEDQLVLWFYEESAKASRTFFLEHQNDSLPSPFCLSSSKSTPVVASAKAAPTAASSSSTDAKATKPAILEAQNDTTMATEGVMIASYGNSAKHKKILVGEGEAMPSGQQSGPAPLLFLPEEPLADETVSKSSAATSGPRCDEISVAAETPTTTTDAPPEDRNDNHNVDTEVPEAPEARESAAEAVPLGGIAELKGKLALRKNKVDADVQLDEQKKKIEKQQEDLLKQQRRQMQGLQQLGKVPGRVFSRIR
ncbi:unnamed protein product [Amoebophrya sp. A25]|nr:unnamed protein product [Amoebophrya sp. A25]|eukprot:GSA25T00004247001.1